MSWSAAGREAGKRRPAFTLHSRACGEKGRGGRAEVEDRRRSGLSQPQHLADTQHDSTAQHTSFNFSLAALLIGVCETCSGGGRRSASTVKLSCHLRAVRRPIQTAPQSTRAKNGTYNRTSPTMASSIASTSTAASSSFGRLLKSSKVLSQYDPSLPLVYTSHGGSFRRSDFGLKRSLPKIRTPAIRVRHLDSPVTKLTDFDYSAREYTFVKRFQELGVGVTGPDQYGGPTSRLRVVAEGRGGCHWDSEGFQSIEKLKSMAGAQANGASRQQQVHEAITGVKPSEHPEGAKASSASPSAPLRIKYLEMNRSQFEHFLEDLKALRPQYKEYLRRRLSEGQNRAMDDGSLAQYLRNLAVEGGGAMGETIESFLAEFVRDSAAVRSTVSNIKSIPHLQKGLSYAPPTLYQSDVIARTVPGRLVSTARYADGSAGYSSDGKPVIVMGITTKMKDAQLGGTSATSFALDPHGDYNVDMGRVHGGLRLNTITMRDSDVESVRMMNFRGSNLDSAQSGSSADKTLLDEDPVLLTARSASGDNTLTSFRQIESRIGSRNWVATAPERRKYANMTNQILFNMPDNLDSQGQQIVRQPDPQRFAGMPESIKNQKARSRAQAKARDYPGRKSGADDASVGALLRKLTSPGA